MKEYVSLGHMRLVPADHTPIVSPIYISHHAVLRPTGGTPKIRVVFNDSCKSSNGVTLNDLLLTGPKLQQDLLAILLRWRLFKFVYTSDIAKMFRQILIHPDEVDFQRVLWSPDSQTVRHYQLLTVTYSLAPAPYLAMRVLRQLVKEERHSFPLACPTLENSFDVDDVLFGVEEIDTLRAIRV